MKRMFKQGLSLLLSLILICSLVQGAAATTLNEANTGSGEQAKRTILFYVCGSDLETESGLASFNIKQVLDANFSADDDVKFIVMTGGSLKWNLESQYLCDPNGLGLSVDEETGEHTISSEYNPYAEYKRAREDMKELYNVKSNVEYLLNISEQENSEREREKSGR